MFVIDPIHYNVVIETLPDVMQRIQLSNPDLPLPPRGATSPSQQTGRIILTETMASDGIPADGGARGKGGAILTLLVGRVLWVGPGKQWEGAFVVPSLAPGEMVLFSPRTVSYEFSLHGRSIKIVPYSEISGKVREVAADSPEWLALPPPAGKAAQQSAA